MRHVTVAIIALLFMSIVSKSQDLPDTQAHLDLLKAKFSGAAPTDKARVYEAGIDSVRLSGVVESSLKVGVTAPDFELPNAASKPIRLSELLRTGPVVLTWYRGGWCPYCNITLHDLQVALPEIQKAGGTLVAVSPEIPDSSLSTLEKHALQFEVLSDAGNAVGRAYGIIYKIPSSIVDQYRGRLDIPAYNHDKSWELPLAATYIIDRNRIIRWAFVDADYRRRAQPSDIVAELKNLQLN
ncbi:AhpC/TSA family protein [candidate division KSB1 bacterium]|nr:AhpC/TSA family protein [candidate division KSB1 bacterium]